MMFGNGGNDDAYVRRSAPPQTGGHYICMCAEPLALERVQEARNDMPRMLVIEYICHCSPAPIKARFPVIPAMIERLFGGQPSFPFVSKLSYRLEVDERLMRRWQWEVEQLSSVDELLMWLGWYKPQ